VVTFPTLCFHEQDLVIHGNGWATLNYWRACVALAPRPNAAPIGLPLGAMLVAYITQSANGGSPNGGWPLRCFYLSCLGPSDGGLKAPWASTPGYLDGVDYPGKDDGGTLVLPSSVTPRAPHCERPTDFRRINARGEIENRLAARLSEAKKSWQRYADAHGFVLPPDHREQFDGDRIPF
jgi:hypothetical protein